MELAARGSTCFAIGDPMNRATRAFRPRFPSNSPALEPLEQRQVLSAGLPTGLVLPSGADLGGPARGASLQDLIATTPGDRTVLTTAEAPDAVILHLSRAAVIAWTDGGVTLHKVADGAVSPVVNEQDPPKAIVDRSNQTVTIPLGQSLGPGRYRIVLEGGEAALSRFLWNGSWDYMEDQTLAEFEVASDRGPVDSAVDAGTIGPAARNFLGSLAASGDRALYQITLGADQPLWRLGLQLDAQRIGSGLWATLTVHDAQGDIVASSEGRRGLASAADDPHLFVALRPGTYYVGVSMVEGSGRSGAYRLAMAADPATEPTRVTGFAIDWSQGAPTGFTITFSDAIAPDSLEAADAPLFAVDEEGQIHRAYLTAVDGGLRRLSFAFDGPLPAGQHRLFLAGEGALVDLIGRAPVAQGRSPGVLASWTIAPYRPGIRPTSMAEWHWLDAARLESLIDNAVGPGGAMSLRFGVGTGTTPPPIESQRGTEGATAAGAGPSPISIGVLDLDLVGRPEARMEGVAGVRSIPVEGRLVLTSAARQRLSGQSFASIEIGDGLVRSPDEALEIARLDSRPAAAVESQAPRRVDFPSGLRVPPISDGTQADIETLRRVENDRLAAASTGLVRWLFGSPAQDQEDPTVLDPSDPRLFAGLAVQKSPRGSSATADRPEAGVNRAGLGVPIGVIVAAALVYRFRRRPPRWWLRRRPAERIDGAPRPRPALPRGPRQMIPPRPIGRSLAAGRMNVRN